MHRLRAIVWPLVAIVHVVLWNHLPSHLIAVMVIIICLYLGFVNLREWIRN